MRNQSGITITALVVAIIVMVILLTVTITVAIKDGGIFDTTKESMHKTQNEMDCWKYHQRFCTTVKFQKSIEFMKKTW